MLARLAQNWVYGGFLAGLALLMLLPLLAKQWTALETLTFAIWPLYMLHQYEEHDADRFRLFLNRQVFGGHEALSTADVFWINIAGVWLFMVIIVWLVHGISAGWAMLAAFLVLVNALAHVGQAVAMRQANPGLYTAILLFVPAGAWLGWLAWPLASATQLIVSLLAVVALHGAIILRVKANVRRRSAGN